MKKVGKFILWVFGALVLLGLAGFILFKLFLTPEKIKSFVETHASTHLKREVTLGQISVDILQGLQISNFKLSESPDFSQGTFLSSDKFVLHVRLIPLLFKKVLIKKIELVNPQINIVRAADGKTYNFSSFASTEPKNTAQPTSEKTIEAFLISKAAIKNGAVVFRDDSPEKANVSAKAINLEISNFSLTSPLAMTTDFVLGKKNTESHVEFKGVLDWKGSLKIETCSLTNGESKIIVAGDVQGLTEETQKFGLNLTLENITQKLLTALASLPASIQFKNSLSGTATVHGTKGKTALDIDINPLKIKTGQVELAGDGSVAQKTDVPVNFKFRFQSNAFPILEFLQLFPAAKLPPEVKLTGTAQLNADVNGTADKGQIALKLDGQSLSLAYSDSFTKPAGVLFLLETSGSYLGTAIHLPRLSVGLARINLNGSGSYTPGPQTDKYVFVFKTNSFPLEDLGPLLPSVKNYGLKGKGVLQTKIISAKNGPDVRGTLDIQDGNAAIQGIELGQMNGSTTFKYQSSLAELKGSLQTQHVKHEKLEGQNLNLKWNLAGVGTNLAKLKGTATLRQGPGAFKNLQSLAGDSVIVKTLLVPVTILQKIDKAAQGALRIPTLENTAYKDIQGDYSFKSGVMTVSKFDIDGSNLGLAVRGTVGLIGPQPLNLKTNINPKGAASAIPPLAFAIKGTVAAPEVVFNWGETGKNVLESLKDSSQIENVIKGIFK